jgi:hypothetical protein
MSTRTLLRIKEREVHPIGCDGKGGIIDAADGRIELVELLVCECGSPESKE